MTWSSFFSIAALLIVCGILEVGGGWAIWKTMKENKPWWWAAIGCLALSGYGFVVTVQPVENFGRIFAAYGGVFIVMSFVWAR
mgnify:CR=1 FL=1